MVLTLTLYCIALLLSSGQQQKLIIFSEYGQKKPCVLLFEQQSTGCFFIYLRYECLYDKRFGLAVEHVRFRQEDTHFSDVADAHFLVGVNSGDK